MMYKLKLGFYDPFNSQGYTRVVIKINGHGDKRSSKFSNLNSVNVSGRLDTSAGSKRLTAPFQHQG